MSARTPKESRHPELGQALRWLRHRSKLTQGEVTERVRARGASLSNIYYSQCERGADNKYPSPELLDHLLEVLGCDREMLAGLLKTLPWRQTPTSSNYRSSSLGAKPKALFAGPTRGYIDVNSTQCALSPEQFAAASVGPDQSGQLFTSPQLDLEASDPLAAEAAELLENYQAVPRAEQLQLLGLARTMIKRVRS